MAQIPPPTIDPVPTPAPQRGDRTTFSNRVDAFVTWLTNAVTEFQSLATNVYNNAVDAFNSATASAASSTSSSGYATNSANSALLAAQQAAAATSTAGATLWVSGQVYAIGNNVYSPVNLLTYRRRTAGSGTVDPSTDTANWASVIPHDLQTSVRTANTILALTDNSHFIDITSGTFSQQFPAAASLGLGWYVYLRNSGTGDITLSLNGTDTIDGKTSFVMYPLETRLIWVDTTASFKSTWLTPYKKKWSISGTWVKPPGYGMHSGFIKGAGSSGDKKAASTVAHGGNGGGSFPFSLPDELLGSTEIVTIGAGGAGVTASGTNGNPGGTTSFGSWLSMVGMSIFGTTTSNQPVGFEACGSATNNFPNIYGGGIATAGTFFTCQNSAYGGASGGSISISNAVSAPGTSTFSGNGGPANLATSGVAGANPSGGGGATQTGTTSGPGGNGEITICGGI